MVTLDSFGLMLEPQEGLSIDDIVDWAVYAERAGYGYIFRSDHLLPTSGRRGLSSPECWVSLGALAARTSRIRFGPMVTPIGFRNPALLARMALSLHDFSKGRLQLAIGAGWYGDEYSAHGYPFPEFGTRKAQFEEALKVIVPLARGERVDLDGKFFSAHTDCLPKPSGHVNVIVGGASRATARLAAAYADELNIVHPTKKAVSRLEPVLRSRKDLRLSMMGPCLLAPDGPALEAKVKRWMARRGVTEDQGAYVKRLRAAGIIVGTPKELAAGVRERMDWGIQRFYFQVNDPSDRGMVGLLTDTLRDGL